MYVNICSIPLKVVNTDIDNGTLVSDALWSDESTDDVTSILRPVSRWDYVWERGYTYKFTVYHDPVRCIARVLIMDLYYVVADSGHIYDCTFRGGRVGVFSMDQDEVEWQNLEYHCVGMLALISFITRELLVYLCFL